MTTGILFSHKGPVAVNTDLVASPRASHRSCYARFDLESRNGTLSFDNSKEREDTATWHINHHHRFGSCWDGNHLYLMMNAMAITWQVEDKLLESCRDAMVNTNAKFMISLLEINQISGVCTISGRCRK